MTILETLALPAVLDSLAELRACAARASDAVGLDPSRRYALQLAIDEIATNVITYGYGDPAPDRSIWMTAEVDDDALVLRLEDEGAPFDPREHELPTEEELASPLETREVGGLGIMLALKGVDRFDYRYEGGRNVNLFEMRRPPSEPAHASSLSLRGKILWIAFLINALCTAFLTWHAYRDHRVAFLDGVDEKLRAAVYAFPEILPPDYHDRVAGPGSIDPAEYGGVTEALSRYARSTGLDYLYSYVLEGGQFYETASNPGAGDTIATGFYYEVQQPPEGLTALLASGATEFREYTDEWGHFRGAFVAMASPGGRPYLVGADESIAFIDAELRRSMWISIALGAAIFVVVWLASWVVLTRILSPVGKLASITSSLSETDFHLADEPREELVRIAAAHGDEAGGLAHHFVEMSDKLVSYLEDLRRTTAEKERLESELQIARDIQMSFLKRHFPPFPERRDFDLFAMLEPAREVGGDLYDFSMLDDEHLLFYVGDVSDKGVPASLFMAVTMTLMKRVYGQQGHDPAQVLNEVNQSLVKQNENLMFVTLVCGVLNTRTGELRYSNAGHNPPVLVRADGTSEWLELPEGLVLGVMPEATYATRSARLDPGDMLVLYTDGVTEAMDPERTLYSEDRLEALARRLHGEDAAGTARDIMASVHEFAHGATQSDDITLLTLKVGTQGAAATAGASANTWEVES